MHCHHELFLFHICSSRPTTAPAFNNSLHMRLLWLKQNAFIKGVLFPMRSLTLAPAFINYLTTRVDPNSHAVKSGVVFSICISTLAPTFSNSLTKLVHPFSHAAISGVLVPLS